MPLILSVETSTNICSAAISCDGKNIVVKENHVDKSHASILNILVENACAEADITFNQIDAVAVSKGPGSYTGLRIGVSSAKGFCFALQKPLIAIDTLEIMALMAKQFFLTKIDERSLICPMIDARRDEVYTSVFDFNLNPLKETLAIVLNPELFSEIDSDVTILCCGNGAEKCRNIIDRKNTIFSSSIYPSAEFMAQPALKFFTENCFEDVAYFEPYYLKDFIATQPKNKIPGLYIK